MEGRWADVSPYLVCRCVLGLLNQVEVVRMAMDYWLMIHDVILMNTERCVRQQQSPSPLAS